MELEIGSAEGRFDWEPGGRLAPVLRIAGITLAADPDRAELPQLVLPADGFDPTLPDLGLGVAVADLVAAVRILLSRLAASWGGAPGFTLAGLLGLHARLPGLPADWPLLGPPPGTGLDRLLADPLGPLRTWVGRIATELSADGTPFATHALGWLRSWLQGTLPALDAPDFGAPDLDVAGAGTYDDPWRLALTDAGHTELLAWLEPAGPPASWASAAAAGAGEPEALLDAAARLRAFAPALRGTFEALVPGRLAGALATVASEIEAGDGIVALDAQLPDDPAWSLAPTLVDAPHHLLPAHPDAIRQVLAQLDAWQPAAATRRPVRRTAVRRRARVGRAAGRRRASGPREHRSRRALRPAVRARPGRGEPRRGHRPGRPLHRRPGRPRRRRSTRSPRRSPPSSRGSGNCAAVAP